jgi:DNA-binding CsgD family transcriptional regulator
LGRRAERDAVDQLLAEAQAGRSGTLVVRGEAGIGKTALLQHAHAAATALGFRVAECCGGESETQFAFAALHQLCAPLLDRAGVLPEPQQAALGVALGLRTGAVPDRFLIGLATLNMLAEAAEQAPLLCLIDDAQWLDQASAQVLAFVARRIVAEGVVLLFATRDVGTDEVDPVAGLSPELRVNGLDENEARMLLAAGVHAPLDDEVRDRILAESRGNPLALLELPRSAPTTRLAGGFELPDVLTVPRRIEEVFERRSAGLSPQTQLLLLLAAAEPTGDGALLWRAAEQLGVPPEAAAPAEASGLLEIDTRVRFRHPLVRSAVYRAASPVDRRRAHAALAAAIDPRVHPDRRAWHRGQAVWGTDEEVAADLEYSADRTRERGGVAAAAAFLQQAVDLTPEPAARARRALAAAHAKHDAGASLAAKELLAIAAVGPLDELQHARLELLRARIAFHLTQGTEVPGMLLDAAETLAPIDAALSRETYLHALDAAMIIGRAGKDRGTREVAAAALGAPPSPGPPTPSDLLLDGLIATVARGYVAGTPALSRALDAFRDHGFDGEALGAMGSRRWLWLATRGAVALFDEERGRLLAARNVRLARETGALTTLPGALIAQSGVLVLAGELSQAAELSAEAAAITLATRAATLRYSEIILESWRGNEPATARLHSETARNALGRWGSAEMATANWALAVLRNGLGEYEAAAIAAAESCETTEVSNTGLALLELVEAATRAGQHGLAATALAELCARADASGTPWALGVAARSRALTASGPVAEEHYLDAIERLRVSRMAGYLARTHLVYGEWLRREGRRQDAREQLRTAHELLSTMGAEAFAERAARELRATGEYPRKRTATQENVLTDRELQIARLVATGATSREVGAQLFLSPRTIEAHLRNIFPKLGITSRRQLREVRLP